MKLKIVNQLRVVKAKNSSKTIIKFPYFHIEKLVFWKNKHDDPIFSLHLMIADILDFIPSKSRTMFSVANVFMRIFSQKLNLLKKFLHINHFYMKMQNTISNETKYIILNMYICVPYGVFFFL